MYVNHKKMKVKELYPELCKMAQITQCELIIYEVVIFCFLDNSKIVECNLPTGHKSDKFLL